MCIKNPSGQYFAICGCHGNRFEFHNIVNNSGKDIFFHIFAIYVDTSEIDTYVYVADLFKITKLLNHIKDQNI